MAGLIHCPAPLPEEPAGPLLTKMLVLAPYKAPKKEDDKKAKETRGGLRRRGASDPKSKDSSDHPSSSEDEEEEEGEGEGEDEEEEEPEFPTRGGRKGQPPHPKRQIRLRGEEHPSPRHPPRLSIASQSGIPGPSPW